ncbi:MAG TPA: malto-oligosyltrehalose synthase [Bryobacteraceae bacterium]|jgi:(1->4)-alpha-D-glucan 1-alpha-D-glucosylmutase|nr:malto-oligosyltrehalose synthase [Bryobacteraceae bacterium]
MSVPSSTYRLQLHAGFGFEAASEIAGYLRDLGVSHVYCSPYLQAARGSTHGYDVVDYLHVNAELGGEAARQNFCRTLGECGLGQILDIVPNHMAIAGEENAWWWDTLENGAASRYAPYFDIEWNAPEERLRNKILLPLLGDHYGLVLAAGDLKLERRQGSFVIRYYEHVFPVSPESMSALLASAADRAGSTQLAFLADALAHLPGPVDSDWHSLEEHHRDKEVIRELLTRLVREQPEVAARIDEVIEETNNNADALDALLSRQNYRLSRWRTAERELVYRRFFDINTLVGVRTEDQRVFEDTHRLVIQWLQRGEIDGVRVDHPDGLRDPAQYFRRLRDAAPKAWIVAEKILGREERLPESWEIDGTTGYDFLNLAGGLFVDPHGEAPLNELYREFTGEPVDFTIIAREKRNLVLRDILGSDVNRLTALFLQICEDHREQRDYTRHEIHEAIREIIAGFPVYRTYVRAGAGVISESDARYISQAIDAAKAARSDLEGGLFEFFRDVLLLRVRGRRESEFVMRFQQVCAAAMAKGVEDTAFYSFPRLVSLNEVGGDPGTFGVSVDDFHRACAETQKTKPHTMLATSTHDTKRSEDVRSRINLLSELPGVWADAVRRWSAANAKYRNGEAPDRKTEYLLYQTLAGTWPISRERLLNYMRKAVREAKEQTSWVNPNAQFEAALEKFIDGVLGDEAFIADLDAFLAPLQPLARISSLSLILLKLTAPGIPDIYQGTELWDISLVDPDNRRPVDYAVRRKLLAELDRMCADRILARAEEGLPKLWVIRQALRARNSRPESFGADSGYEPLWASGPKAAHVIAFRRGTDVITIAPRLLASVGEWGATLLEIPEGHWRNQFTGELLNGGKLEIAALFEKFPVALLTHEA